MKGDDVKNEKTVKEKDIRSSNRPTLGIAKSVHVSLSDVCTPVALFFSAASPLITLFWKAVPPFLTLTAL